MMEEKLNCKNFTETEIAFALVFDPGTIQDLAC